MGWNSVVNTSPTKSTLKSTHSNGYYRFESSILFFSGHGSPDTMGWIYKDKGGDYSVGIRRYSTNNSYSNGREDIGIGQYRNNLTDLAIFAGCNTAEGTNNLAKYIVDEGAKTSIGWVSTIGAGSHTNW